MKWSTLPNCRSVDCNRHDGTIDEFAAYVEQIRGADKDGEAICCATFSDDKRALRNVEQVYALMFDFDGIEVDKPSDALGMLNDYTLVAHSSYSHGIKPGWCFRVFVPLARPVSAEEYSVLWQYIYGQLDHKPDAAAKDASRLNFLRRESTHKTAFFRYLVRDLIDPDKLSVQALVEHERERNARRREREAELAKWRSQNGQDEHAWIESALEYITPTEYQNWRDVGMALKRAGEEDGLSNAYALWENWSRKSDNPKKNDSRHCQKAWDSFRGSSPSGVITLGTVWHMATMGGWDPPKRERLDDIRIDGAVWTGITAAPQPASSKHVKLLSDGDHYLSEYALLALGRNESRVAFDGNAWQIYDERTGCFSERPNLVYSYIHALHGSMIDMPPDENGDVKTKYLDASHKRCSSVENKARIIAYEPDFFARTRPGLAFSDGFFDSTTCEFRPHSPIYRAQNNMEIAFPRVTEAPIWAETLREVLTEDDAQTLEEYVGLALMGRATFVQRALFLVGAGSNGKSTVVDALLSCFPKDSTSSVSPHQVGNSQRAEYYLHDLRGRLLNVCAELEATDVANLGAFKSVVSGDMTSGRPPHGQIQRFKPLAGHVFACNRLPNAADSSDGFWRRAVVIGFDRQFTEHTKDPTRPVKLRAERSGITARLLAAGQNALERGDIYISEKSKNASLEWRNRSSAVRSFLLDCHASWPDTKMQASALYKKYTEWANENGRGKLGSQNFYEELRVEGCEKSKSSSIFYDIAPWRERMGLTADVQEYPF